MSKLNNCPFCGCDMKEIDNDGLAVGWHEEGCPIENVIPMAARWNDMTKRNDYNQNPYGYKAMTYSGLNIHGMANFPDLDQGIRTVYNCSFADHESFVDFNNGYDPSKDFLIVINSQVTRVADVLSRLREFKGYAFYGCSFVDCGNMPDDSKLIECTVS